MASRTWNRISSRCLKPPDTHLRLHGPDRFSRRARGTQSVASIGQAPPAWQQLAKALQTRSLDVASFDRALSGLASVDECLWPWGYRGYRGGYEIKRNSKPWSRCLIIARYWGGMKGLALKWGHGLLFWIWGFRVGLCLVGRCMDVCGYVVMDSHARVLRLYVSYYGRIPLEGKDSNY